MKNWLKLTLFDSGEEMLVNMDAFASVHPSLEGAILMDMDGGTIKVTQSLEEIRSMIIESRRPY